MRYLYSLLFFFFTLSIQAQMTDVTFLVDMNTQAISPNGVHLAGSFQGWDPSASMMSDNDMDGIYEIPLVGSVRYPDTLMDSWTYLENKIPPYRLREEYYELFLETLTYMRNNRLPGILPYYADPCHVVSQTPFEKTIDLIKSKSIDTLHGRDIPKIISLK